MHLFVPRIVTQNPFENNKIISYSLIVYAKKTQRYVILQRKHSVEFLLTLSGHYRPSLLLFFLPKMTNEECQLLKQLLYQDKSYFYNIYVHVVGLNKKDVDYAYTRFLESQEPIDEFLKTNHHMSDLQWTWPKGRLNVNEDGLSCAHREFLEETEILLSEPLYLSDQPILVESFKSLSCKVIETYGWLYVIEDEIPFPPLINHKEVNDRKWVSLTQALQMLNQENLTPILQNELYKANLQI